MMNCCREYATLLVTECGRSVTVCPVCDSGVNECTEGECGHDPFKNGMMATTCEGCGDAIVLTTIDNDGVLIGDECHCGEYVTRYMPGEEPR